MKVDFRKPGEIDHMADDLLRKYFSKSQKPFKAPIPVDDLAEGYFNLDLRIEDLTKIFGNKGVLGAVWFDHQIVRIDQTLENQEGRFAFTLAHEIGHWWMHRPQYVIRKMELPLYKYDSKKAESPAVVCRSGDREPAEWQADNFAAKLLMPKNLIFQSVEDVFGQKKIEIPRYNFYKADLTINPYACVSAQRMIEEGGFSNVSKQAMLIRLNDLQIFEDPEQEQRKLGF